jgi:hypothetical protein
MSLNTQEFTDVGRTMLGRAQAGETLTVSKIVVGSGSAAVPGDLWPLTALITHEMDVAIFSKVDDGEGTLTVEGSFNADTAPQLFELRELGVMAHIGAEADQLYSVANVFTDAPDLIDPASTGVHAFKIKLVIERATSVTVTFGTSTDILAENIGADTVGPGWYKEKILNTLRFKRAAAGTSIELIDDGNKVTIGVKTLAVDLDLYVPLTHPDAPSADVAFNTIQEALAYLKGYVIPPDRFATIHIDRGTWSNSSHVSIDHPNGVQIKILGYPTATKTITSVTQSLGPPSTFTLYAAAGTFSDVVVGDWVLIDITQTAPGLAISGIWPVSSVAVDGSSITYTSGYGAWTVNNITTGKVTVLKSSFTFALNATGFYVSTGGIGLISDLAIIGPATTATAQVYGISIFGVGTLRRIGVRGFYSNGFSNGIGSTYGGNVDCFDCASNGNDNGFTCGGGAQLRPTDCYAIANKERGFYCEGSTVTIRRGRGFLAKIGVLINNMSYGLLEDCYCGNNSQWGISISSNSHVASSDPASGVCWWAQSNTLNDVAMTIMSSLISAAKAGVYGTANVTPRVLSADGCWFSPGP